jgi:hypothetical protein
MPNQDTTRSTRAFCVTTLDAMKARPVSFVLTAAILLLTHPRHSAAYSDDDFDYTPGAVTVDAVIVRPLCLVATAVGTGLFVVTLPIAAVAKSVDKSAKALVGLPGHHTFVRRLGNLSGLSE